MPTYEFMCEQCDHEWEEFLSITAPNPESCPNCNKNGNIKKLISGGSGKGIVELTGHDLKDHLKSEAKKIKAEAHSNPTKYANLLGEERYHNLQTKLDRRNR